MATSIDGKCLAVRFLGTLAGNLFGICPCNWTFQMRPLLTALAVLGLIALVSCGAPSTSDFVQTAAMSDMYEVEAGKIAGQKGQSDSVKQFGQNMVNAHSQTSEQLKGIVQQQNIKVDLPTKLDSKHQGITI
jgi:predicted outer membrane protein